MWVISIVSDLSNSTVVGLFETEEAGLAALELLPDSVFNTGDYFFSVEPISTVEEMIKAFPPVSGTGEESEVVSELSGFERDDMERMKPENKELQDEFEVESISSLFGALGSYEGGEEMMEAFAKVLGNMNEKNE